MDIDPKTIGLLAASAGFLDPRGGMMGGVASGLGAYAAANQMKSMQASAEMNQRKLLRQLQLENHLQELTQKHGNDPNSFSKALMSSPYPEAIKLGIDLSKARQVKQFLKTTDDQGNPVYKPGFNTGEVGDSVAPISEKLMQINRGSQIDLADPYTGQAKKSLAMGIDPGKIAQLDQSERHFGASHALAQQNSSLNQYKTMMDYSPEFQAQKAAGIAASKAQALNKVQAASDLPKVIQQGEQTIQLVDDLLQHPGFKVSVGKTAPIGSAMSYLPGTDAASFDIALKQLKGKQFLEAFETLKGGGQITQIEGEKATQAMSRMEKANTEQEFVKASREFQDIIRTGINRAKEKAGAAMQAPSIDGYKIERLD